MLRASQLESSLFTVGINQALADPRCRLDDELTEGLEVTADQNRGFFMAEGWRRLAAESNELALMLRYQAQAEREYRRAIEDFERLKKLRNELPNEPILIWEFVFNKMQWYQWHRSHKSHRRLLVLHNVYNDPLAADAGVANLPGAAPHRDPGCADLMVEVMEGAVTERERQTTAIAQPHRGNRRVLPKSGRG